MNADLFAPAPFWLILAAVPLELLFAWPASLPHPVQWIGALLNRLEKLGRACAHLRLAGALCLVAALVVCGGTCAALTAVPWLGWLFAVCLAASGLALGALLRACGDALSALERGEADNDLQKSRHAIGMLVSRDTSAMPAGELRRALAETLAENFNDAFVAPLFWLLLGGPVGLWLYKTASTVDSMWGYRTPAWKDLGMAGARLDDVLAWLPARLSALLLRISAEPGSPWPGWSTIRRQAAAMSSPNAGWPMAAAAWLHGTNMGGPTPYFGEIIDKPRLGPWSASGADWNSARLHALLRHVRRAGLLWGGLAALISLFF